MRLPKYLFLGKKLRNQNKIYKLNERIQELESKGNIDINLIEEVLSFTKNIHKTYKEAPPFLKRHYLRFFFEKVFVKNKKISKIQPTPIFAILRENHQVIIRKHQLPLVDLFRNQKIEFDYSLDDIKLFYASLQLQEVDNFNFTSP